MTNDVNINQRIQERTKIFEDIYNNIIPERMPVCASLCNHVVSEYSGIDPRLWHYNSSVLLPAYREIAAKIYSDTNPFAPPVMMGRPAGTYQLLGSQSFQAAESGYVQHPEVVGMYEDEYKDLIEGGYDFLIERVIPRQHKNMDPADPIKMGHTIQMAMNDRNNDMAAFMPEYMRFTAEMGYHVGGTFGAGGFSEAPFDFLADQLRSFSEVSKDIRRHRSEILDALEVLTPIVYKMGRSIRDTGAQASVSYPLHMPTYMRVKDIEELYMPSFRRILEHDASQGIRSYMAIEDDWTRLYDIILDNYPAGSYLAIDECDPKLIKEKLGKKYILGSGFRLEFFRTCTTERLLDKEKEFLDIMLPDGGYFFGLEKDPLSAKDLDLDKYAAVLEFARDYSHYDNAGESYGTPLNSEKFAGDPSLDAALKSKYLFNWEEFKAENPLAQEDLARASMEANNNQVFNWYMTLLV